MGYTWHRDIKDFWPDDTENEFYLTGDSNLEHIIELAKEKFGADISLDDISIRSEYIHTSCLTYDQYDPSDYTNFIVVERIKRV